MKRLSVIFSLLLVLGVNAPMTPAHSRPMSIENVMASIILQMPLVVSWSQKKQNSEQSIEICATSQSGVGDNIRQILATNALGAAARFFDNVPENRMPFCHILLINEASAKRAQYYVNLVRGHGVMTIGLSKGFVNNGGVLGFLESNTKLGLFSNKKVRFDINVVNARFERLALDPLLLELAENVER